LLQWVESLRSGGRARMAESSGTVGFCLRIGSRGSSLGGRALFVPSSSRNRRGTPFRILGTWCFAFFRKRTRSLAKKNGGPRTQVLTRHARAGSPARPAFAFFIDAASCRDRLCPAGPVNRCFENRTSNPKQPAFANGDPRTRIPGPRAATGKAWRCPRPPKIDAIRIPKTSDIFFVLFCALLVAGVQLRGRVLARTWCRDKPSQAN